MLDTEMQAIPIDEVVSRSTLLVDYYLRLGANKFILVAKAGSNTPVETINKYKAKSIDRLFVRIEDYHRLLEQVIRAAGLAASTKGVSEAAKLAVIGEAMAAVYGEVESLGFNETVFTHAKLVNHATLSYIEATPPFGELVAKLAQASRESIKHSMMVSMISTMIGTGHDWIKPATLEKLALGGFLHDIGKTKLPQEIVSKPVERMSRDEKIIYQSHPEIGRQILAASKSVPDDVALIVYEHHELSDGSGFPRGLKDFQTSPLARVVSLANEYTEIVLSMPDGATPAVAQRALEMIEFHRTHHFNKDALRALRRLVRGENLQAAG